MQNAKYAVCKIMLRASNAKCKHMQAAKCKVENDAMYKLCKVNILSRCKIVQSAPEQLVNKFIF